MKISKIAKWLINIFLEILFPKDELDLFIERIDLDKLKKEVKIKKADIKIEKKSDFENFFYLFDYKDKEVSSLIWYFKFKGHRELANFFAEVLFENFGEILKLAIFLDKANLTRDELKEIIMIPIPIHPKRRRERGFNQCELICEEIMRIIEKQNIKISYQPNILKRSKYTTKQSWGKKKDRLEKIKGVFEIRKEMRQQITERKIILIDDVVTTGSTLKEASRPLWRAGASKIIAITIAH